MQHKRSVTLLLLVGAITAAVAALGAGVAAAAEGDVPTNRGWSASADRSGADQLLKLVDAD